MNMVNFWTRPGQYSRWSKSRDLAAHQTQTIERKMNDVINTLRPKHGGHFADDSFKLIFLYENCCILTQISKRFIPKNLINNKLAFVSDNGLALNKRRATIWTNNGKALTKDTP